MNEQANSYVEIVKFDKNADGTATVYGKATDDSLDIDQQICDDTWLSDAMPAWFKSGGNIREQHSNIAAGVAKEYENKDGGHWITALVVDPTSVKKVETGVLKGFSIGIKNQRIVRDNKAANGRIVDGQIVEVSLVDRPANPSCQLVLAKSVGGESTLTQVEEMVEVPKTNEEIIARAKVIAGDTVKFDEGLYQTARVALAQLIIVEAQEMVDGANESNSLNQLLVAVNALEWWYAGEEAEGETGEEIEMAADKAAETECACKCGKCADAKGCDSKECKCAVAKDPVADEEKSTEADEEVAAENSEVSETPAENSEVPAENSEVSNEEPTLPDATEETKEDSEDDKSADIKAIVDKAIQSATDSIKAEVASLLAAKEAAETKAADLENELAKAKSLAVAGGPKRTAKPVDLATSDLLTKANAYKAKANATTDPKLAEGYRLLAEKFTAKASEVTLTK